VELRQYLRDGKIHTGLEVTRLDLDNLLKKHDFISISKADKPAIVEALSGDVVGVIMGNINNIDEIHDDEKPIAENPDCWFVSNRAMKPYKSLDGEFNIGEAKQLLELGYRVKHKYWENSFLIYVPESKFKVNRLPLLDAFREGTEVNYEAHIDVVDICPVAQEIFVKPYVFTQDDIMRYRWVIEK